MNDESLILQAQTASVAAWNQGDLPGHLAIYDESVITMSRDGPRQGVAAIEVAFRSIYFGSEASRPALRLEQVAVRLPSTDVAVLTGRYVLTYADGAELSGWTSLVWLRTATGWRVVHDHSS